MIDTVQKITQLLTVPNPQFSAEFTEEFLIEKIHFLCNESPEYSSSIADTYCVKSIQIRSISNPYFPVFGLNTDQKNSVFGQFLRST